MPPIHALEVCTGKYRDPLNGTGINFVHRQSHQSRSAEFNYAFYKMR